MIDKALCTEVFEAVGPEGVERGLKAKANATFSSFHGCFLALAYGAPGALEDAATENGGGYHDVLGISEKAMWAVVDAFDETLDHPKGDRQALRRLAREWLEQVPVKRVRETAAAHG